MGRIALARIGDVLQARGQVVPRALTARTDTDA
jgi:hypothetical protein